MANLAEYMTPEEFFYELVFDENGDYETVEHASVLDSSARWSILMTKVIKNKSTGRFYRINWDEEATEMQDIPFDERYKYCEEVIPVEVTKIEYVPKDRMS